MMQYKAQLDIFLTPSCSSLSLTTPRLVLRQIRETDLPAIKRIKLEPTVQRTQLYGSPHELIIKDMFLGRYIRSSMPRIGIDGDWTAQCRDAYIFALTLKDPAGVDVGDGKGLRLGSRIKGAEGYVGEQTDSTWILNSGRIG